MDHPFAFILHPAQLGPSPDLMLLQIVVIYLTIIITHARRHGKHILMRLF